MVQAQTVGLSNYLCDLLYRMVIFMQELKNRRFFSVLLAVLLAVTMFVVTAPPVSAANRRFITELRVAAGEDAVNNLEAEGWSVTMVGLNVTSEPAQQVYLAYKMNTGSPITNVIVSPNVGNSYTDANGIVYHRVSNVDVDEGIGGGAGCLYATRDEHIGAPLVGIDVLRGSRETGEVLYPITNDGAEIVRTPNGEPADIEKASSTDVIYLAQIRDGMVRPYISEIGIVTDTDKWNAVYTACERGYNVEGDIDDSSDTYTIIVYERTANASEAITNITAVSAEAVKALEQAQIVDGLAGQTGHVTANAVSISGSSYVRVSSQPVNAKESYYIYRTKASKAGNPVSMLYVETPEQTQNFLFGTWANAYFFSPGVTTAYTYSINEDLYTTLWEDQTVCSKLPVQLIDSFSAAYTTSTGTNHSDTSAEEPSTEEPSTVESSTEEPSTEEPSTEEPSTVESSTEESSTEESSTVAETVGAVRYINLTMLTPRGELSDTAPSITGLRSDPSLLFVERTQRSDRVNKFQASVFGNSGFLVLIPVGVLILTFREALHKRTKRCRRMIITKAMHSIGGLKAWTMVPISFTASSMMIFAGI